MHRTWQHIHDGPHRDRGGPLVYGDFTKIPSRPPQNAIHSIGEPGRTSIIAVDRMAQLAPRPMFADVVSLSQVRTWMRTEEDAKNRVLHHRRDLGSLSTCSGAPGANQCTRSSLIEHHLWRRELLLRMSAITLDDTAGTCHHHACCQAEKSTNGGVNHDSLNHLREISPLSPRGHPALRPSMHHASGSDHRKVVVPFSLPCHCGQHV